MTIQHEPRAHLPGARVVVCVVLALGGCTTLPSDPDGHGLPAVVQSVVDGDTIIVRTGSRRETVRLIGIDTPETKHPDKPVQCGGPEATDHMRGLLPAGTTVRLVRDEEARDIHGRLLAYVWRESDGLFINLNVVADGHGVAFPFPPNTTHASSLAAAARTAQKARLGLWGACRG